MYVRASLERRETRAGHYREDYPVRDDAQLAWLCLRKDADSTPEFFRVPVPLEQYKHPVTRYYQGQLRFPGQRKRQVIPPPGRPDAMPSPAGSTPAPVRRRGGRE